MAGFTTQVSAMTFVNQNGDHFTVRHSEDDIECIEIVVDGHEFWLPKADWKQVVDGVNQLCADVE